MNAKDMEWIHSGFTSAAEYELHFQSAERILLISSKGPQMELTTDRLNHIFYAVGKWSVEAGTAGKTGVTLRLRRRLPADDTMEIRLEGDRCPQVTISLLLGANESKTYSNVAGVQIIPNQMIRVKADSAGSVSSTASSAPRSPDPAQDRALKEVEEKLKETESQLKETINTRDLALKELEIYRKTVKTLESAVTAHAEDLLQKLPEELETMSATLQNRLKALDAERRDVVKIKDEITAAEKNIKAVRHEKEELDTKLVDLRTREAVLRQEKEELDTKLTKMHAVEEDLKLDCDNASKELESLRRQYEDDLDTASLLQEEAFLKNNSLLNTLEQIRKELDAAEKRIGLIVQVREKINARIQGAILAGDGQIPLAEELGGKADGIGSSPEKTNQ